MLPALSLACALAALVLAGLQGASLVLAGLHMRRASPKVEGERPKITLIRPVCGLDPKDHATLGSSFLQDYPDFEVLFSVADEADPVVPLVRELIAAHPQIDARLMVGEDLITGNPKLNNVNMAWEAAASDWIVMADSNLMLPQDYLSQLQAEFRPGVGMVSSPAYGSEPETLAAHFECAWLNTHQARWQLAADQVGVGYSQGKSMFFRRPLVEAAGGIAALGRDMAEDVASTKITRAAGQKVRLPPAPFAQPLGARDWRTVWRRQIRWAKVRRLGFPALYAFEILNGALPFVILAALGGIKPDLLLALTILWYAGEWRLAEAGGWPRDAFDVAMWVLRDLASPVLWLRGWMGKGFEWRGNTMHANETVKAETSSAATKTEFRPMTFDVLIAAVASHGATILLPLSIIEGPIVSVLAGYAAKLGVFRVVVAFAIVVLGDMVGDVILYFLGHRGLRRIPEKWLSRMGLVPERLAALSDHFAAQGGRTIILGKLTHSAGAAVLVAAGLAHMPFWKFLWYNLLGSVPKSAVLIALGYVLGEAATRLGPTITEGSLILLVLIAVGVAVWWFWSRRKAK